ncbi:MAG: hypothetical protein VX899_26735 [Myxococcota bacterium]|nr:hypothetical protein [Myxococcota bacterium]
MSAPRPCPQCQRPNAPHRVSCLYCGQVMPNPTAAPPARREGISKELDRALEKALRGGNLAQVEQVLGQVGRARQSPESEAPVPRPVLAYERPEPQPSLDPEAAFAELLQALTQAQGQWQEDPQAALEQLSAAGATLSGLQTALQALPAPRPIALPPFRLPWALVIDPPADPETAHRLATCLRLDLATARMLARAPHTRVAMRSRDRADLEQRAAAYTQDTGRPANVVDADTLRACGRPLTALEIRQDAWVLAKGEQWAQEPEQVSVSSGRPQIPPMIRLVVPGEVRVQAFRARGPDLPPSPLGERALQVVDLHGPDAFVRVVAGISQLPAPGDSAIRALRAWLDQWAEDPQVRVLGARSFTPGEPPAPQSDDGQTLEASGWPQFEEHSRAARLLLLG